MRKLLAALLIALAPFYASANPQTSSINPGIPASGSQMQTAPLRQNFQAAYNDINGIFTILSTYSTMAIQNASAVAITGGTINNTVIGGSIPTTGSFSALNLPNLNTGLLFINTGTTSFTVQSGTIGTGLALSGSTVLSNAEGSLNFQPGLLTSVNTNKSAFTKVVKASTVDNIVVAAQQFTCSVNPALTLYECGTSATCASPTTIGSATISAAGTAVTGTISSSAITAGDYVAWSISAGTCTVLDIAGTAQYHSN